MKKYIFENMNFVNRLRIPENRDLKNGLRLNRNERVENFPKKIFREIVYKFPEEALATYHDQSKLYKKLERFYGVNVNNVLITSGIDGAIKNILEVFCNKSDLIAFPNPTYAMYNVYCDAFNLKKIHLKYTNGSYKLDKEFLFKVLNNKNLKIIFLPNPNQPIEDNLNIHEIKNLLKLCQKRKVLLVLDEAYYMFGSETGIKLINEYKNLIIMRTFSKSFGLPSIRIGSIISNKNIIKILNSYRLSYESNFLSDQFLSYFLDNKSLYKKYINKTIEGRDYLKNELEKNDLFVNESKSNFLLIKFNNRNQYIKVIENLNKNKIYVKSGYTGFLENHILITCGPKKFMNILLKNIKKKL